MKRGAELGRSLPRVPVSGTGTLLRVSQGGVVDPIELGLDGDIENGTINAVTGLEVFRPGQQVMFYLTVYNAEALGSPKPWSYSSWISRVRLKPWWLRQADEFRAPGGSGGWTGNDRLEFGGATVTNNRAVWFPTPKMIDISEWQSVNPPPAAPPRQSDSIFVDDLWTLDLQDPNDAAYQNTVFTGQQRLGRSVAFMYVSHGYALGFTHEFEVSGSPTGNEKLYIDLTWQVGTL